MLLTPSLLARYAVTPGTLPVLNLPTLLTVPSADETVGVTPEVYRDELATAPFVLEVPSVGIRASVVPDVPLDDERAYWRALTRGVALARSSALLTATSGNSFIFGHSGRLTLRPSPYDTIFAKLPGVVAGDEVVVTSEGQPARYRVTASRSVAADDQSVLAEVPGKRTLTLLTCWPLGTWYKRWIVVAEPVIPSNRSAE